MSLPRKIYLLDPKTLSPETIAVTFAKSSRSPLGFQQIAAGLSDKKSADFHEKWVVGYGHASVAEHAVLHIAVENISRLAVECLESNRLASYTEKSSRYQVWDREYFVIPPEWMGHPLEGLYLEVNHTLFDHYRESLKKVSEHLMLRQPRTPQESEQAFTRRIQTCSADVCRFYLPASALANVGVTINARELEHALRKMLSHPLSEIRQMGEEIKQVACRSVPTLVKYAEVNAYLNSFHQDSFIQQHAKKVKFLPSADWLKCYPCDQEGAEHILAALLFRLVGMGFDQAQELVRWMTPKEKARLADELLGNLGEHDIPLRELEYAWINLEMVIDQGAYFELKRHRMMTQTAQRLTPDLGYALPSLLSDCGLADYFENDMQQVKKAFRKLEKVNPDAAAYIIPNGFNRRVLLLMNLRSAYHFIHLRTSANAHFSMRRAALRVAETIQEQFPLFARHFMPKTDETWQGISSTYFSRLI